MIRAGGLLVFFSGLLVSCGSASRTPSPAPATLAPPPPPRATATVPEKPAAPASSVHIESIASPLPAAASPRIEIVRPTFGEVLNPVGVREQPVTVRVAAANGAPGPLSVALTLDGRRPRRLTALGNLTLGDLLPEDEALAAGLHVLFAVALDAEGRGQRAAPSAPLKPFSLLEFFVGERSSEATGPAVPRLFCLSPTGTEYAAPTSPVLLDLYPVGSWPGASSAVSVLIEAPALRVQTELEASRPHALRGLPRGDVRVSAWSPNGARAACVVTLNPEANPPKAP